MEGREQTYLQRTETKITQPSKLTLGNMEGIKTLPEKPTEFINSRPLRKSEECVS